MGLSLLTVALESGADYIPAYSSLMCLVKDDMCKNLIFVSLIKDPFCIIFCIFLYGKVNGMRVSVYGL